MVTQGASGCAATSAIATVIVSPALAATITPNTEQTVCEGEEVTLNVAALNGQGTASYQWYQNTSGTIPANSADSAAEIITGEPTATDPDYTLYSSNKH